MMRRRQLLQMALAAMWAAPPGRATPAVPLWRPADWMQDNLGWLGRLPLARLCLPGSHDAGMSVFGASTTLARPCNTLTQSVDLLRQLQLGVRFLDIRPVLLRDGRFATGHYSWFDPIGSWQGALGQSLDAVLDAIARFGTEHAELLIVNLSHDLAMTADGGLRRFEQSQWDALLGQLGRLSGLEAIAAQNNLEQLTLRDCIGSGRSALLVRVDAPAQIDLRGWSRVGFHPAAALAIDDVYANTSDLETMVADQLAKLIEHARRGGGQLFVLSWTLTLQALQAVRCADRDSPSILQLAARANAILEPRLQRALGAGAVPNVLYLDGIDSDAVARLALRINRMLASA